MILDEAIHIIGQRGYYGFSIKELADNCGLTVAGVLHHFGTKVELLVALLKDRDERDAKAITGSMALAERTSAELVSIDQFRTILHDTVVHNSTQPEIVRLYSMLRTEAAYPEHPAFQYFRDRNALAYHAIFAVLDGKVEEPRSATLQLLSLMGGLEDLWIRDQDSIDIVAEWDRAYARIMG